MAIRRILVRLTVGAFAVSSLPAQTVLYLEDFSNSGEFTRPATAVGWKGFWDQGEPGPAYNLAELADPDGVQYNSPLGNPAGVNNSPVAGAEVGAGFWSPTAITNVTIATQEFAGVLHSSEVGAFLWDYSLDSPSNQEGQLMQRALVQVGGSPTDTDNWFASDPMIVVDSATLSAGGAVGGFYQGLWERAAVSAAGNWIRMPFYDYANKAFVWPRKGAPKTEEDFAGYEGYTFYKGSLPDGVVHGFGILIDNRRGGNFWIDNYTILSAAQPPGLPVPRISIEGEDILISFNPVADHAYQLLKSTDGMKSFIEVGGVEWGNDGVITLIDVGARPAAGNVFYRIRVSSGLQSVGGLHSESEVVAVRQSLAEQDPLISAAFTALETQSQNHLDHVPQPPAVFDVPGAYIDNEGHREGVALMNGDAWAAYSLALHYRLDDSPGRVQFADKAIGILDAWATHNHGTSGHDGDLVMAYAGVGMIFAAQLLSESDRWGEPEKQRFEGWVRTVFLGSCSFIRGRQNNWGDWGILGAIAAHQFLGEAFALEADIVQLRNKIDTKIDPDGVLPAEVSRGRGGIWYTYFSLAPLTAAARILHNAQLADFFSYVPQGGGGIRPALDYLFSYCLEPGAWPHYEGDDLINPPAPDSPFYGSLFEAMAGVYDDADYAEWVIGARPVMNYSHHFAWAVPSLMRVLSP
jgi:hypothetical protein